MIRTIFIHQALKFMLIAWLFEREKAYHDVVEIDAPFFTPFVA